MTPSDRPQRRARIVVETFRSAQDPRLRAWLLFRSQLLRDVSTSTTRIREPKDDAARAQVGVLGVWRLLATNNRELGRCARVFESPRAALDASQAEQGRVSEMNVVTVRGPESTKHGWIIRREERHVLLTARWYESAGEAAAAGRAAVTVLASAEVAEDVRIGTASGRRSRIAMSAP